MKTDRDFPRVIISDKGSEWIRNGHPWIYDGEVISADAGIPNGSIVDAVSLKGRYLGSGFYSGKSRIRIRLLTKNANEKFDEAFWRRRITYAWNYRKTVMKDDIACCRVIFGEADGLPGLTVDRFSDVLVTQTLSIGIENLKDMLFPLILDVLRSDGQAVRGIYERNDVRLRKLEGLEENKGWYGTPENRETVTGIEENGVFYSVDVENGQKTGFFLDQKYNRFAVARIAEGKSVLDCFTHTGSFALNAAKGGAQHVTAVDISNDALLLAEQNAIHNGLADRIEFICADVFDYLRELQAGGSRKFDMIILDPPAFTKSRKTAGNAERGYREINSCAMKILPRGGYLATASCSHFMTHENFERMLMAAASDAAVELKQIEVRQQAPDHPILWNVPETDYLKFYIFQVV